MKVFELSQDLRAKWLTADYAAKRRILEITCLNFSLDGVTLVPAMRKPFDMLAEGLDLKNSRGDWIRTSDLYVPNDHRNTRKHSFFPVKTPLYAIYRTLQTSTFKCAETQ